MPLTVAEPAELAVERVSARPVAVAAPAPEAEATAMNRAAPTAATVDVPADDPTA